MVVATQEDQQLQVPPARQMPTSLAIMLGAGAFAMVWSIAVAVTLLTWNRFGVGGTPDEPVTDPPERPAVIQHYEGVPLSGIDIDPPTRLDLLMAADGAAPDRCADYGGTYDSAANICYGVDY